MSSVSSDSEVEKRVRGPVKRAKINIPSTEEGSLLSLLANPRFSDVKVIVGEEETQYDLHRAIICLQSTFFEAACKEGFVEGNTREINLPDIHPDAFETVARWLYSGGFTVKEKLDTKKFTQLYKAADFLGVDSLKQAMLSAAAVSLQEDIRKPLQKAMIEKPLELVLSLTDVAPCSDWQALRQIVDRTIPHRQIADGSLRQMADTNPSESNGFFAAIMLDAYQELINSVFCTPCMTQIRSHAGKCQTCRRQLHFQKREGPPQKPECNA